MHPVSQFAGQILIPPPRLFAVLLPYYKVTPPSPRLALGLRCCTHILTARVQHRLPGVSSPPSTISLNPADPTSSFLLSIWTRTFYYLLLIRCYNGLLHVT